MTFQKFSITTEFHRPNMERVAWGEEGGGGMVTYVASTISNCLWFCTKTAFLNSPLMRFIGCCIVGNLTTLYPSNQLPYILYMTLYLYTRSYVATCTCTLPRAYRPPKLLTLHNTGTSTFIITTIPYSRKIWRRIKFGSLAICFATAKSNLPIFHTCI